jgi:hypothetical protein
MIAAIAMIRFSTPCDRFYNRRIGSTVMGDLNHHSRSRKFAKIKEEVNRLTFPPLIEKVLSFNIKVD